MSARVLVCVALLVVGCNGSTGGGLVSFTARVRGVDPGPGGGVEFDNGKGFHVQLTSARFHVGAVYLSLTKYASGSGEQPCIVPGIYAGQAVGGCNQNGQDCGVDFDLLSPELVTLTDHAQGTANGPFQANIWLTGGDINANEDATPILQASGTATKDNVAMPFSATVTIGSNRVMPPSSVATPGQHPICGRRIVVETLCLPGDMGPCSYPQFTLENGGSLELRVDPSVFFANVDFSLLTTPTNGVYAIADSETGAGIQLFDDGVQSAAAYTLSFTTTAQ